MDPGWYGPIGTAVVAIIGLGLQWWTKRVDRQTTETALREGREANKTDIADKVAQVWERTNSRLDKDLATLDAKCDQCLMDLDQAIKRADAAERRADAAEQRAELAERRADRNDRTNSALIDAWTAALPLLAADHEATKYLRATIRAAREARYESQ